MRAQKFVDKRASSGYNIFKGNDEEGLSSRLSESKWLVRIYRLGLLQPMASEPNVRMGNLRALRSGRVKARGVDRPCKVAFLMQFEWYRGLISSQSWGFGAFFIN